MSSTSRHESGLVIDGVSHAFGDTTVLREVSLSVGPGKIHCLLGPSGSGKTTLLRLVAGLEPVQTGRILIGECQIAGSAIHLAPEQRSIGFVFQDYALFPHLNVRDNVLFGMPRVSKSERFARVASLLASVGLSDFETAMPHTLSGGQQQRVALVRAMARDPRVMLLDEPFSGLDARLRSEVREVTLRVLKATRVTTLMVTHDPLEALAIADSISVIDQGQIQQTGSPGAVYAQPTSRRVAETFGEINRFVAHVSQGQVQTPCGVVAAADFPDNRKVEVLIRPESIRIAAPNESPATALRVHTVRPQGYAVHIELKTRCGQLIRVLAPRDCNYRPGSTVRISLVPSEAIILGCNEK